jgi:2-dehydropantoate 2-reductase
MREVQKEGAIRDTFIGLSKESAALGAKLGITFETDLPASNLKTVDSLTPETTASLQKDLARGSKTEIQEVLFNVIALAKEAGLSTPVYDKIAEKFRNTHS